MSNVTTPEVTTPEVIKDYKEMYRALVFEHASVLISSYKEYIEAVKRISELEAEVNRLKGTV